MRALYLVIFLILGSCAHSIHNVHVSDFTPAKPIEAGDIVKAKSEQFVIMGFTNETLYVEQAYQKLLAACPNGPISNISTQFSTSLGFFSWTNKVLMQGLCLRAPK